LISNSNVAVSPENLMPWIGDRFIGQIHLGALQPWIDFRRKQGRKASTINHGLKVVRRVLNLAA